LLKKSKLWAVSAATCVSLLASFQSHAQSIDYVGLADIYKEPITTSANGSPLRKSETPVNMEIITSDQIQKSGVRTIPEILRFLPGINVQQKTFGQTELSIRGYNQNNAGRVLVLLNGRQVYTDFFGQVIWDNIPVEIDEIQQIEVVKGPNTALFGYNAVSGVINIITTNPLYDQKNTISTSYGTQDYSNLSTSFSNRINDKIAVRFSGGLSKANNVFDDLPSMIIDDYARNSFSLDTWLQLSEKIQGQIEVTSNHNDRGEFVFPGNTPAFTKTKSESIRGRILADTDWGMIETDVYHNTANERLNLFIPSNQREGNIEADNHITVAKISNTFPLNTNHTFRISGEYREASNIFTPLDNEDLTYKNYSTSGLWDWRAKENLRTSLAIRYDSFYLEPDSQDIASSIIPIGVNPFTADDYEQRREALSWNLGAVYQATELDTFRTSISRGVELPSFTEFGLQFFSSPTAGNPNGLGSIGSPNTKTTKVDNYEIGYDRKLDPIHGNFRSAIFYQENSDVQGFAANLSSVPNFFAPGIGLSRSFTGNIGDSKMYGVELGVVGKFNSKWNWGMNYTYANVEDNLNNKFFGTYYTSNSEYEDSNRDHTLNIALGYEAEEWNASINGQYVSSSKGLSPTPNENSRYDVVSIDSTIITNINFSYKLNDKLTWAVSGANVTGDTEQSPNSTIETIAWTTLKYNF
jgi:outer membrane receptor for ferrienterochelin and colicins